MPINKEVFAIYTEAEDGPVGRTVGAYASIIRDLARLNAGDIMHRMPEADRSVMLESIDFEQNGTDAVVGISDNGEIERYLATKELRELSWLFPAAAETFTEDNSDTVQRLVRRRTRN